MENVQVSKFSMSFTFLKFWIFYTFLLPFSDILNYWSIFRYFHTPETQNLRILKTFLSLFHSVKINFLSFLPTFITIVLNFWSLDGALESYFSRKDSLFSAIKIKAMCRLVSWHVETKDNRIYIWVLQSRACWRFFFS